jgi:L-asparaginase II
VGPIRVAVRRDAAVESLHRVHAVAVRGGAVVQEAGDRDLVTFFRSSAKPIQALLLARARPDATDAELAVACASHQAEPVQMEAVRSLLARAPASADDLECGPQEGRPPEPIYHNCSGKHAGFLAVCRERGWETRGYRLVEHPLQRALLVEVAGAAEMPEAEIPLAVDGCGVVTFALALARMAYAFGRLPEVGGGERVLAAMRARPELVGGEGSWDTALMRALPGWAAKRGAEGLFCATDCAGLGVAAKVEDGNPRALQPALASFLAPLGHELVDFARVPVENSRGEQVGEIVCL